MDAQTASDYGFAVSSGSYAAITGGTVLYTGTFDDATSAAQTIPSFTFCGTAYTTMFVNTNGWLTLGGSAPTNTYTPISTSTGSNMVISPFGRDLQQATLGTGLVPEVRWETVGSEVIVQWQDVRRYTSSVNAERISFQARLNTATGQINFVYKTDVATAVVTSHPQVGVKNGTVFPANMRNLYSVTSWATPPPGFASTSTITMNATIFPATGLTYTFSGLSPCDGVPPSGGFINNSTGLTSNLYCATAAVGTLNLLGYGSGKSGNTFQWQNSPDGSTWTDIAGATTQSYAAPAATGVLVMYRVKVSCAGADNFSAPFAVQPPNSPATQASNIIFNMNTGAFTGAAIRWTNGSGGNRMVKINTVNSFTDPVNGATGPGTANTVYSGSGEQLVYFGTGTSVTVTGLSCSATYFVRVYEYNTCTSPSTSYYYNTATNTLNPLTTGNNPITNPYTQDFNVNTTMPDGWGAYTLVPAASWFVSSTYGNGGNGLYKSTTGATGEMRFPKITVGANQRIRFDNRVATSFPSGGAPTGTWGSCEVQVSTDCGATFTSLGTYTDVAGTVWVTKAFSLASYSGQTIVIKLKATWASGSWYAAYDNFFIEDIPPGCNGNPTPGAATSSASAACSGTTFNLTLAGYTNLPGISLQWQSSPAGAGTWANIAGATNPVAAVSQTAATDYRCVVTCTPEPGNNPGSSNSNTVAVPMELHYNCYCSSVASTTFDEEMGDITIGALVNASNCTTLAPGPGSILNRYSNYKTLASTDMQVGATQNFTLNILTCGGNFNSKSAIYVDWNHDGDFTDVGEEVFESAASVNGPHQSTGSFAVPAGASLGVTGMRVMNVETSGDITPCMTYSYGETEDYVINVVPPPPCTGTPEPGTISGANAVCPGQSTVLTLINYDPNGTITLQWQESPDNTTYTDIVGATSAAYTTAALLVANYYRVNVTCGSSGITSTSPFKKVDATNPAGGTVTGPMNVTAGYAQTYTTTGYFGSIQWQSSTDNITFTDIAGATLPSQSLVPNTAGTIYLRVKATLTGCTDAFSASIAIVITAASYDPVCGFVNVPVDGLNHGPYSNYAATTQVGEPVPPATGCQTQNGWCIATLQNSVWFTFDAPASGSVKIETFATQGSTDNQIAVYSAPNCAAVLTGGAVLQGANDDVGSGAQTLIAVINQINCLTPNQTYFLQMDGYGTAAGLYNIKITEVVNNAPPATFSGLPSTICIDAAPVTLTPTTAGGAFSGAGITGSSFNPTTAGAGTHTINYNLAVPNLGCFTSQEVTVTDLVNYYPDADGDGFGDETLGVGYCATAPPAGWITQGGDCNDTPAPGPGPGINPLATDICNNTIDENCDGDDSSVEGFNMDITPDCKGLTKNKVLISGVSGGLGGYLYSRDGGAQQSNPLFSNIPAGSHTFTVHAGDGCSLVQSLELEPNMTLTPAVINVSCYGLADGEATVAIAGGYAPYSYTWFKGTTQISTDEVITDLVASTYKVNVLDNEGCEVKASAIVTQPPKMNLKTVVTPVTCFGTATGAILVDESVIGGVGPFQYAWTGGATGNPLTNVVAGTYVVTATDLGTGALCTSTKVSLITQPTLLAIDTITMKPTKCFGSSNGSAKAKAGGGTGTRVYTWNTTPPTIGQSILNQPAGFYTVVVNDANGCTTSGSIQITQPTQVSLDVIESVANGSLWDIRAIASGGTPTYKLASQMFTPTLGDTSAFKGLAAYPLITLKKLPAGTYKFFLQDKNKCQINTIEMAVPIVLKPAKGRDEKADLVKATNFRLVPNPTSSSVQLVFDGAVPTGGSIEIHSASGQLIQRIEAAAIDQNSIRVENLPAGVLMVTYSADNHRVTKRLVVLN